jgi:hypothetical protein
MASQSGDGPAHLAAGVYDVDHQVGRTNNSIDDAGRGVWPAFGVLLAARLAWDLRIVGAALSPTPIINWLLFGYGVPAASFALAGCFATGGRHVHQSHTRTRRHTLDVNALADRQGARPHHLGGAVQAELRAASIPHVILRQRLSSGIKETVLRDRTEFPVKHAQLLDQEPPSQREFSHKMPGLRVANTGGARYENEPHDRHVENATLPVDICWWSFPGVGVVVRAK